MTLLLLEALGAGMLLIGIIWWTMFSGRENGELPDAEPPSAPSTAPGQAQAEPAAFAEPIDKNKR